MRHAHIHGFPDYELGTRYFKFNIVMCTIAQNREGDFHMSGKVKGNI